MKLFTPLRTSVNLDFQEQPRSETLFFCEIVFELQKRFRSELKPPRYRCHGFIKIFSIVNGAGLRVLVPILAKMSIIQTG